MPISFRGGREDGGGPCFRHVGPRHPSGKGVLQEPQEGCGAGPVPPGTHLQGAPFTWNATCDPAGACAPSCRPRQGSSALALGQPPLFPSLAQFPLPVPGSVSPGILISQPFQGGTSPRAVVPPTLFPEKGAKMPSAFQELRIHEWTQRAPRGGLEMGHSERSASSALGCPCRYGTEREREKPALSPGQTSSVLGREGCLHQALAQPSAEEVATAAVPALGSSRRGGLLLSGGPTPARPRPEGEGESAEALRPARLLREEGELSRDW